MKHAIYEKEVQLTKQEEKYLDEVVKMVAKIWKDKKLSKGEKVLQTNIALSMGYAGFCLANVHKMCKK